ncbi:unnamed protein product [Danaus chrysippus]|uniref:(African queen) hypothetical protein n=1 Tax=Danaus chrysippus TaxID=151541 RepID=A0A8J2R043_9NEOP|nr:unnamed protein product [Danaus chrysippus]
MTLIGAIFNRAKTKETSKRKYTSPPPEIEESKLIRKKRKRFYKYRNVKAIVDSSPPSYDTQRMFRSIPEWVQRTRDLYMENARMLFAISSAYMNGGRVDSHWTTGLYPTRQYYENRLHFYRNTVQENIAIYKRIEKAGPRVVPTKILIEEWNRNKVKIVKSAKNKFVLFPTSPVELIEDSAFKAPDGVKRPRVYIQLRARGHSSLGYLHVELFTEICPLTCALFLELMMGDGLGYGYVGTRFFRYKTYFNFSTKEMVVM